MKGMIFFILGIIIVFGLFSLTQRSTENNQASDASDNQEIEQQIKQ